MNEKNIEKVFEVLTENNKDTLLLVAKGMQVAQENMKKKGE